MGTSDQPRARESVGDWIAAIAWHLDREQPFHAYDHWKTASAKYPRDPDLALTGVLALIKARSIDTARAALAGIALDLDAASESARVRAAEVRRLLWEIDGAPEDLDVAHRLYSRLYADGGQPVHGVQAALLAHLGGRDAEARSIARRLRAEPEGDDPSQARQRAMIRGHAALLLGEGAEAAARYATGAGDRADYHTVVDALRVVRALAGSGVHVPAEVEEILRPPTVVIFVGQPIDPPGLPVPLFPPAKEASVAEAIRDALDEMDAQIGYCSAACGSDLLFAEALLARGGEVLVVLPCAVDDFIEAKVAYAGEGWVERFRRVVEASTVRHATTERYLGHDALMRFGNDMIAGLGWVRAEALLTEPRLLAALDWRAAPAPGSPADFIDHWADVSTLHLVMIDQLALGAGPLAAPRAPVIRHLVPERQINAMLFADVVGYSRLAEEHLPAFFRMLARVTERVAAAGLKPALVEAWGDALYVVMPSARDILRYAFVLKQAFLELDPAAFDLPLRLSVRIGLHAGPVFPMVHPVSGRPVFVGSQVNRAARIEPITIPGEVYASTEYVALLTAEENIRRHALRYARRTYAPWFKWDYLGVLDLPKDYGDQAIYHLMPLSGVVLEDPAVDLAAEV